MTSSNSIKWALEWWEQQLQSKAATLACAQYLKQRDITEETHEDLSARFCAR